MTAHNYHPTCHFSPYALDPDTPESDYEVHLIRTHDPAYIPPDSEAWPANPGRVRHCEENEGSTQVGAS